jgi:arylsulfatase A-like enzyme
VRLVGRAAPLVLLLAVGCRPHQNKVVVYDFAERLPVADLWSAREILLFGTPAAEPHQVAGFYAEAGSHAGDPYLWAREDAEISFTWASPAARAALVDLAPYGALPSQSVAVALNGTPLASFSLSPIRQRYRVALPESAQKRGDNRLHFHFAASMRPSEVDKKSEDQRHLSAAFYSVTVAPEGDQTLEDLRERDAPSPFQVAKGPALIEVGPSIASYAVKLPEAAELRFRPDLHPSSRASAGRAVLKVTLEETPGVVKDVWSGVLGGNESPPPEVIVPLPGPAGRIVRIGLAVSGADAAGRFAWGVFGVPRLLGLAGVPGAQAASGPKGGGATERLKAAVKGMNVLFIILDAGRAQEFSCYGNPRITTPSIDRIASEGVVFEEAITPAVYTLGAMSSVWTSQYPDRNHSAVSFADRLPKDRVTLVNDVLSPHGVFTAGFVANAVAGRAFGFDRGFLAFEETFKTFGSGAAGFRKVVPQIVGANRDKKMFLYVHFREPHFPYDPPPPFDTKFGPDSPLSKEARGSQTFITDVNQGRRTLKPEERDHLRRLYDGNLAYADQEIGALRATLESAGLWDKTVTVVAADHGEELDEHGWVGHNVHLYEESVHVPLIVRFPPGRGPKGVRVPGLVSLLDVAPTIADVFALSGSGRSKETFQGKSLLPMIAGEDAGEASTLSRTVWDRPRYALREGPYSFFYDTRTGEAALFNREKDPGESHDLRGDDPLRAAYEQQTLNTWIKSLSARESAEESRPAPITRAECENLKSLGYLSPETPCPSE